MLFTHPVTKIPCTGPLFDFQIKILLKGAKHILESCKPTPRKRITRPPALTSHGHKCLRMSERFLYSTIKPTGSSIYWATAKF